MCACVQYKHNLYLFIIDWLEPHNTGDGKQMNGLLWCDVMRCVHLMLAKICVLCANIISDIEMMFKWIPFYPVLAFRLFFFFSFSFVPVCVFCFCYSPRMRFAQLWQPFKWEHTIFFHAILKSVISRMRCFCLLI